MAGPEDAGVDKQKILKSVAEGAAAQAPPPRPAAPTPNAAAAPSSPLPPGAPVSPSVWQYRNWYSTAILGSVGALWLGSGLVGKWRLGIAVGGGLLVLTVLSSALLLLVRRRKSA